MVAVMVVVLSEPRVSAAAAVAVPLATRFTVALSVAFIGTLTLTAAAAAVAGDESFHFQRPCLDLGLGGTDGPPPLFFPYPPSGPTSISIDITRFASNAVASAAAAAGVRVTSVRRYCHLEHRN